MPPVVSYEMAPWTTRTTRSIMAMAVAAVLVALPTGIETAKATTTVAISVNDGNGAGTLSIVGDEKQSVLSVYESELDVQSGGPAFNRAFVGVGPEYVEIQRRLTQAMADRKLAPASSTALAKWLGPFAVMSVFANPSTTLDSRVERGLAVVVTEHLKTAGLVAVPPCVKTRFTDPEEAQHLRAVKCPVLKDNEQLSSFAPPNLWADLGGGRDEFRPRLRDNPRIIGARRIWGGAGNDSLHGSQISDTIAGDDGADLVYGGPPAVIDDGKDVLWGHNETGFGPTDGAPDRDTLFGGSGSDLLFGQADNDVLWGGDGDDNRNPWDYLPVDPKIYLNITPSAALQGGPGRDIVVGEEGSDTMQGNADQDTILARESDMAQADYPDPLVDCHGGSGQPGAPLPEGYRRSGFDAPAINCTREIPRPVARDDLLFPRDLEPFFWEGW